MSKKITFRELAGHLSDRTGKSRNFTRGFVRELVGIIESGLHSSGSVTIAGFGRFELRWMDERAGINPRTGEEITIPARNKVVFKPYKSLRNHVNFATARMESQILHELAEQGADTTEEEETLEDLLAEKPSPLGRKSERPAVQEPVPAKNPEPAPVRQAAGESRFRWSYLALGILVLIGLLYYSGEGDRASRQITDLTTIPGQSVPALPESGPVSAETDAPATTYTSVRIENGQTLWNLAGEHLGDPYLWPWIFYLNRDRLNNPNIILAGTDLAMPVPAEKGQPGDQDLREIAQGYLSIYNWYREQDSGEARYFLWAAGSFHPELLNERDIPVDPADLMFARNS